VRWAAERRARAASEGGGVRERGDEQESRESQKGNERAQLVCARDGVGDTVSDVCKAKYGVYGVYGEERKEEKER
jgi:hypothetical protein